MASPHDCGWALHLPTESERCSFVREKCQGADGRVVNYAQIWFCHDWPRPAAAAATLSAVLAVASFLAVAASGFLVPNLGALTNRMRYKNRKKCHQILSIHHQAVSQPGGRHPAGLGQLPGRPGQVHLPQDEPQPGPGQPAVLLRPRGLRRRRPGVPGVVSAAVRSGCQAVLQGCGLPSGGGVLGILMPLQVCRVYSAGFREWQEILACF